jgi:ribosome biogenesis GTPase / thiamine phosphate phosphatase
MPEKKRTRAEFRKNRGVRARRTDWTRGFDQHGFADEDPEQGERVSGKGELTRKRTIRLSEEETGDQAGVDQQSLEVDEKVCRRGRVLTVHGLVSEVRGEDGVVYQCATRRLLKTLSTDLRHVVAAGDRVLFLPVENSNPPEGFIERIEPRHGTICRAVRGRQQLLVTNVDQVAIVSSAAEPPLKPNLIDRMLVAAEKGGVRPLLCINKIDLVEPATLQPLIGVYSQMGYEVLVLSAKTGFGVPRLRRALMERESMLAGQSGVGKSTLLNAVDPALNLRVRSVNPDTEKGRHTTTTAQLLPLGCGGYVVDTPGIRQFELWDVIPEEVAGYFRDLRPYGNLCRFPDCTHTHEDDCAVKDAVADGRLDDRRYESYCRLIEEEVV